MCWTKSKTIGHSSKTFGTSQKTLRTPWCPKLVTCLKETCVKKKHCCQKSAFLEPMFFLNRGGFGRGRFPTLKSRKYLYSPWFCTFRKITYQNQSRIRRSSCSNCLIFRDIRSFCHPLFSHSSVVKNTSSLLTVAKPLWNWLPLKYPIFKRY